MPTIQIRVTPTARRLALVLLLSIGFPALAAETDGFRLSPSLGWSRGDHRVDLGIVARYRYENWKARSTHADGFHALRTRVRARYEWKQAVALLAEVQDTRLWSLSSRPSGAAATYRANTTGENQRTAASIRVRQLFLEGRPAAKAFVRVGRQAINQGTLLGYEEASWTFLKGKRLSQRLIGTVGWTHGERSYDGVAGAFAVDHHRFHGFAAQPTTGLFEIEGAYKANDGIVFGGADWTLERGGFRDDTELGAFFIAYRDDRSASRVAGLFGDIDVYTLGGSLLGVYDAGPGEIDVLLWGAFQWGDFVDTTPTGARNLDQLAGALVAELGYRLPDVPAEPWLRVGVNFGSGDSDPADGKRGTFFNLLPTNHPYYGYADQLAISNLVDLIVQLILKPLPKLTLELTFHRFWLSDSQDFRYFGAGAFNATTLGYGRSPGGKNDVGMEIDAVLSYALNAHVSLSVGYAHLFGGGVFETISPRRPDTKWAFAQAVLRY